jgi:4-amino-4-deoxy-L-arabinose transferase-like glycosyltransferase
MLKEAFHRFFQKGRVWKILFLTIGLLLVAVRFLWLNEFPPGINHDEYEVILSARSIWQKGVDISGVGFPQLLFATQTGAGIAGLPSFILSPFYGIFNLSVWGVRIPYVLVSLLTIFSIAYIAFLLTKRRSVFWISILVGLTNPWLFFYSRAPTEAPIALIFATLGLIVFLKAKDEIDTLYSIPLFIASFFSYQGAKITVPIFVFFLILAAKLKTKVKASFLALFFIVPIIYFLYSYFSPASTFHKRQSELIFSKINEYSQMVDEQRRDSITFPFSNFYYNKYTYLVDQVFKKYVGFISPDFLFFKGDEAVLFEEHGLMLPTEIIFILIGIIAISKYNLDKRIETWQVFLMFFIAGPLSSAISYYNSQYIYRGFLLIPGFVILSSLGIIFLRDRVDFTGMYDLLVAFFYCLFFLFFLIFFFFRYPVKEGENHFLSERVLSSYISRVQKLRLSDKIVVVSPSPGAVRGEYSFFSSGSGQVEASADCQSINNRATFIISSKMACPAEQGLKPVVIQNPEDTGAIFKIYNDKLCLGAELTSYRRYHLVSDYAVEQMDNATFCNRWIGRYE